MSNEGGARPGERRGPLMGVAVWLVLLGILLAYQGFTLISDDDRWPPITEIIRDAVRYPAGRWVLFGLWLWLGWHVFVRSLQSPYTG